MPSKKAEQSRRVGSVRVPFGYCLILLFLLEFNYTLYYVSTYCLFASAR